MLAPFRCHVVAVDSEVRHSLERLLLSAGFTPLLYDSGVAVLDAASNLSAGCLIVDVSMPEMGEFELLVRLSDLGTRLPVILMTAPGDVPAIVRAMTIGAVDFVEKPLDRERLLTSIHLAMAEARRVEQDRKALEAADRIALLSPREHQVLDGLAVGHSNKAIAFDLGISVRTVEVHRARMLHRLGTRHVADAIRLTVMAALVPPTVG
jgi:two-component system, LuxR family, response regulator FixJ